MVRFQQCIDWPAFKKPVTFKLCFAVWPMVARDFILAGTSNAIGLLILFIFLPGQMGGFYK